jgi:hypothetical protein
MKAIRPLMLATALALAGVASAFGDPLGGSSSGGELWTGPNMINPGSRFQLDTIQPGRPLAPDGSLSAPPSLGQPGPLSPSPGVGMQPEPRRGVDLERLRPGAPSIPTGRDIYGRDVYGCQGKVVTPAQQIGSDKTFCGYGRR